LSEAVPDGRPDGIHGDISKRVCGGRADRAGARIEVEIEVAGAGGRVFMFSEHPMVAQLEKLLLPRHTYRPYPKAVERTAWEGVPAAVAALAIHAGEQHLEFNWPALPAVRYMDFHRDGNRTRYEQLYFERRRNLAHLVIAECVEHQGRFLEQIVNGIWC